MVKKIKISKYTALLLLLLLTFSSTLYAAGSESSKDISIFLLLTGLLGGMGMFLYGMEMMSDGMKMTAGNSMRVILEKLTSNKFLAVFVGAFVTMVIQSSSATTVMLVSFVNSGLLNFAQALGVILGSNIGSTVTAQIVAFKVTDYALLLIAFGAMMSLFSKKETVKNKLFINNSKKMSFKEKSDLYFRLERLLSHNYMGNLFKVIFTYKKKKKFLLGFI